MPLNTSPSATNLKKKNFLARSGADLTAALEAWSQVPADQAEAAGIAAHEEAERRAARRRQAAQIGDQAKRQHSRSVQTSWLKAVPAALRIAAFLPPATWAQLGLLVARSNAGGVARLSLREMQGRLAAGSHHTVVDGTARLEALGWIAVERRRIGRDLNAVNTYRLVHPALIEAARQAKGGGTAVACLAPKQDQKEIHTNVQGAPLRAAGLHEEGGEGARPPRCSQRRAGRHDRRPVQRPLDERREASGGSAVPLAAKAEALLTTGAFTKFSRPAYRAAVHRHGPLRAAQAVVAAGEMCRVRAGSADPVRDPPAYLGGMLRRPGGQLRPDVTLGRIEARSQHQREKENER